MITGTGIYASKEDFEKLKNLALQGWSSGVPIITFSVGEGIKRDQATIDAKKVCHQLALNYGLPEIQGYYGINNEKEFVRF